MDSTASALSFEDALGLPTSSAAAGEQIRVIARQLDAFGNEVTGTLPKIEFAPDNIRVNAILPGAVDTPMLRAGLGRGHVSGGDIQTRLDNLARKTVNGRVGKPEEIAHAIYFLADDSQSSFMTGQAVFVDGGMSLP